MFSKQLIEYTESTFKESKINVLTKTMVKEVCHVSIINLAIEVFVDKRKQCCPSDARSHDQGRPLWIGGVGSGMLILFYCALLD
jgi:hypothetical protein